jgi:hypothetical protein
VSKPQEPTFIKVIRQLPSGHVQWLPHFPEGYGKLGTSAEGFLRELDEWAEQIWMAGYIAADNGRNEEENPYVVPEEA